MKLSISVLLTITSIEEHTLKILVTGAFGNVGESTLLALLSKEKLPDNLEKTFQSFGVIFEILKLLKKL